jgi:hypothetical protein
MARIYVSLYFSSLTWYIIKVFLSGFGKGGGRELSGIISKNAPGTPFRNSGAGQDHHHP